MTPLSEVAKLNGAKQVVEEGSKRFNKAAMLEGMEDYVPRQGPEDSVFTRLL